MQRLLIFLTVSVNFLFGDLVAPPAPSSLVDQPLDNDVLAAASNGEKEDNKITISDDTNEMINYLDNINALVETEAADGSYYDQYYNNK